MTKRQLREFDNEPLDADERDVVIEKVQSESPVTRYAVLGLLYTAMTAAELSHLRNRMVRNRDQGRLLVLSGSTECRVGNGRRGPTGRWQLTGDAERGDGCRCCNGTYTFDNTRSIPVQHNDAIGALEDFFDLYDLTPSNAVLRRAVDKFGDKCGIARMNVEVLRYTYPVILAEHGFTRVEIGEAIGVTEGTREDMSFSEQVGPYCRDRNPFICDAELGSGETCSRPAETGADRCARHSGSTAVCGALLDNGSRCEFLVDDPDERCVHHSTEDGLPICGAELDDGGTCQSPALEPGGSCFHHSEVNESTHCLAETTDGGRCMRAISQSKDVDQCSFHRNDHTCNAETARGTECTRPVDEPEDRCRAHKEDRSICGAETDNGGVCQRTLSGSSNRCHFHSDD